MASVTREVNEIVISYDELEAMKLALENAYSLSLSLDIAEQLRRMQANLTKSRLTKEFDNQIIVIENLLNSAFGEANEPEEVS